jgi:hypothetical protein
MVNHPYYRITQKESFSNYLSVNLLWLRTAKKDAPSGRWKSSFSIYVNPAQTNLCFWVASSKEVFGE